ncbi:MAG: hypothetical protein HWD60_08835 [Defluviicoccus sp.]|nr:MAG: hypothetical protein HWD60_08835 [Defluviicoccus sp.]
MLRWTGSKPAAGIQEAARIARYRLLIDWCCGARVLHLLLGHHAGDQMETVLYRLLRGSGLAGLAGMVPLLRTRELQLCDPCWQSSRQLCDIGLKCGGNRGLRIPATGIRDTPATGCGFCCQRWEKLD